MTSKYDGRYDNDNKRQPPLQLERDETYPWASGDPVSTYPQVTP